MGTVKLCDFTRTIWNTFYQNYKSDSMMDDQPYKYDEEKVNYSFDSKMKDTTRKYFAICKDNVVIGQIYLKNIHYANQSAEFGIALINDLVKNQGFGTKAIRLLLDYAFNTLKLSTIYADTVIRNRRSQHILEKKGFIKISEDSIFNYYKIDRFTFYSDKNV